MTYDVLGPGLLDYQPCRYGTSRLLFRGPKRDLSNPYIAFVGTNETYGKFVEQPFPALVEQALGVTCANFGQLNAGVDAFSFDPFVLDAASAADISVIQVLGAQNMTNRFYSVHPRRNDRFLEAATLLKTIYREVDFADFHFNKHMLGALLSVSTERFQTVRQELQEAWVARMRLMLKQVKGKSILLWIAGHSPDDIDPYDIDTLGSDPLFVTRDMINQVKPYATSVVEVVVSEKAQRAGTDGMIFGELDAAAAAEMMGPAAHAEAAKAVTKEIRALF